VATQGFGDVEVRPLHPKTSPLSPTGDHGTDDQLRELVGQALFGAQDYAVLGYKLPVGER
jgi:hypothetical protein